MEAERNSGSQNRLSSAKNRENVDKSPGKDGISCSNPGKEAPEKEGKLQSLGIHRSQALENSIRWDFPRIYIIPKIPNPYNPYNSQRGGAECQGIFIQLLQVLRKKKFGMNPVLLLLWLLIPVHSHIYPKSSFPFQLPVPVYPIPTGSFYSLSDQISRFSLGKPNPGGSISERE